MSDRQLLIRCLDCQRSEDIPWLPLLWRVGTCGECAATSVSKHLLEFPRHRCEVLPGVESPPDIESCGLRPVDNTQKLLGKGRGW
jgi:hypothetical protein